MMTSVDARRQAGRGSRATAPGAPVSDAEAAWLTRAVELATANVAAGGGPFGAMIVEGADPLAAGDRVLAQGTNRVTRDNDPTAHAEVVAIREACTARGDFQLRGCVLVTSCEPCPLCLSAALWARVDRVLFAADRFDAADGGFDDLAFYDLFATERSEWGTPVTAVAVDRAFAPFEAWLARPDRVAY